MPISGSTPNKTFTRSVAGYTGSDAFQQGEANGRFVLSADADESANDIVSGVNASLFKDGSNFNADIPTSGSKFTGVGNASARNHFAAAGQVADGSFVYAGTSSGTDTITATLSPAITAYAAGQRYHFKAGDTNTGAATINLNSVGAKSIKKGPAGATDVVAGDITAGGMYTVEYDGTNFQLLNPGTQNVVITAAGAALLDDADAATQRATLGVISATDTDEGLVELATSAETITGSDTTRAVTPADLEAARPGRAYATYATNTDLSAVIPHDDTIPQSNEGTEIITASITPKRSSNRIRVTFTGQAHGDGTVSGGGSSRQSAIAALFQDSGTDAIAATACTINEQGGTSSDIEIGFANNLVLIFEHSPATTSAVTYKIRVGPGAGTMRMNGTNAARRLGGVSIATLVLEEIFA